MAQLPGGQKGDAAKREEEVLTFWRTNKIFEKSLEKEAPQGEFVFYDGPPFATGLPHHGSLLSSIIKDVIPRYKTMRGFRVRRRWGWDTHGLPIESLVEKELGLKTKKDIEAMGVDKFNEAARATVLRYVSDWQAYVERIGRWVDYDNSYKTMDNTYIESVWWALKSLWDKELLYEGRKVLMYCTHCETPLAKAEIAMDNTYKDVTEEAVTIKFKVKNPDKLGLPHSTYFLAWTTTPWTLPGNVGLAVGPDIAYVAEQVEDGSIVILAEDLAPKVDVRKRFHGRELVGMEYEPLYEVGPVQAHLGKKHMVMPADFVTVTDGTGIVHTAVMYGEEDFQLGQKEGLPMVQLLEANGTYGADAPEFIRGVYIKEAERAIKRDLQDRGLMYKRENHTHSYPHCWRCGTPLIYNAVSSWFINIQKVKQKMLSENEKVNWVPEHLKHGRFYNIMENAPDWTISRNRFWASPLPIWKQKGGGKVMVIGSIEEMKQKVHKSGNSYFVMRHGRAENNERDILNSTNDIPCHMTEEGKAQVETSLKAWTVKPDLIVVSPLIRTKETAEMVRAHFDMAKDAVIEDARLAEVQFRSLNNKPRGEYLPRFTKTIERYSKQVEDAETWRDVRARVGACLQELEATHKGKSILIITHDGPIIQMHAIARGEDEATLSARLDAQGNWDSHFAKNGEIASLDYTPLPRNAAFEIDLHRPYTDSIVLLDEAGNEYERIKEVVDCWVESGSMPFAEYHYPFENKEEFEKRAPGDFIAEYIAQTRTWFYYMHAMGVLLFDRHAFKNVVSTGTILASDGQKISKSKRNYTDPLELIDQYGSDAMRLYLMGSPVMQAEDVRFRDEDVREAHNRVIGILWNTFKFYELYKDAYDGKTDAHKSPHVLDRWVLALLDSVIAQMTEAFDAYDTPRAVKVLRAFVDDYSTWYVRRSRERVKAEGEDMQYALATQREVLLVFSRLIAPIMPFVAEGIWRGLSAAEESVHVAPWPDAQRHGVVAFLENMMHGALGGEGAIILKEMALTRSIVSHALEARDKAGMRVRQPLSSLTISEAAFSGHDAEALKAIIAEEVNVKQVLVSSALEDAAVELNTELTDELREEGFVREFIRAVQALRKEAKLQPKDEVSVSVHAPHDVFATLKKHEQEIIRTTNAKDLSESTGGTECTVGAHTLAIAVVKR